MRVAVVVRSVPRYRHHVYEGLQERGHEVTLLVPGRIANPRAPSEGFNTARPPKVLSVAVAFLRLPRRVGGASFPLVPAIGRYLRDIDPDVILAEGASNIGMTAPAMVWARRNRVPLLWWTLGRLEEGRAQVPRTARLVWDHVVASVESRADGWLGYSQMSIRYFARQSYCRRRTWWSGNVGPTDALLKWSDSTSLEAAREALGYRPDLRTAVYAGRLDDQKRVELLLSAWSIVAHEFPDAQLVICGDGPRRQHLERLTSKLRLSDVVTFTGHVGSHLRLYYRMADLFVLPGLGGVAIAEAMACKAPVIVSVADGTERDLVSQSRTGSFFDSGDAVSLAQEISRALRDPEWCHDAGERAWHEIDARYRDGHHVDRIESALTCLRKLGPRPRRMPFV